MSTALNTDHPCGSASSPQAHRARVTQESGPRDVATPANHRNRPPHIHPHQNPAQGGPRSKLRPYGTVQQPIAQGTPVAPLSTPRTSRFARTCSDFLVADSDTPRPSMSAQGAAAANMKFRFALRHRKLNALTPYIPDAWEHWLHISNCIQRYLSIPDGLRFGFEVGLSNPPRSFTPPQSRSICSYSRRL